MARDLRQEGLACIQDTGGHRGEWASGSWKDWDLGGLWALGPAMEPWRGDPRSWPSGLGQPGREAEFQGVQLGTPVPHPQIQSIEALEPHQGSSHCVESYNRAQRWPKAVSALGGRSAHHAFQQN